MALKTNSRLYNIRPLVVGKARELVQMHAKVDRSLPPGAIRESFPDQWNKCWGGAGASVSGDALPANEEDTGMPDFSSTRLCSDPPSNRLSCRNGSVAALPPLF